MHKDIIYQFVLKSDKNKRFLKFNNFSQGVDGRPSNAKKNHIYLCFIVTQVQRCYIQIFIKNRLFKKIVMKKVTGEDARAPVAKM